MLNHVIERKVSPAREKKHGRREKLIAHRFNCKLYNIYIISRSNTFLGANQRCHRRLFAILLQ